MDKISAYTDTADGDDFTEGDPVAGVPATEVDEGWLNAVQEEIVNVIEGAGITRSAADNAQLKTAIYRTFGNRSPAEAAVIRSMKDGNAVKVVCLGDSITYGEDADLGGQATTTYPEHLQALLREFYQNNNITLVNAGVSGDTTQDMIDRFATDVSAENPDLIILMAGTNDAREAQAVSLQQYADNMRTLIGLCGAVPVVILGITPRFKEHETANGEGVISFYRTACEQIARGHGITYVDTFARLMSLYRSRSVVRGLISSDGSHYTPEGYKYLAEIVFAYAMANDDLRIAPGQFKDSSGQWIVTDAAESEWGGANLIDKDSLIISAATVESFLYLEEPAPADLVVHFVMDNSNGTTQSVDVTNLDIDGAVAVNYKTSPKVGTAGAPAGQFYFNDYPVPVCKLKPGLNRIQLTTATSVRLNGFSVLRRKLVSYQEPFYDAQSVEYSTANHLPGLNGSPHHFEKLSDNLIVIANSSDYSAAVATLIPDTGVTTRWRVRAQITDSCYVMLGQMSNTSDFAHAYQLEFDGTNAILRARDSDGSGLVDLASVAFAVATSGKDVRIDITTDNDSWSLWVDGTLIYTDDIPLSICPLVFRNTDAGVRVYVNPVVKKGENVSDTGVLVGEEWISILDNKRHLTDRNAADVTLTYS